MLVTGRVGSSTTAESLEYTIRFASWWLTRLEQSCGKPERKQKGGSSTHFMNCSRSWLYRFLVNVFKCGDCLLTCLERISIYYCTQGLFFGLDESDGGIGCWSSETRTRSLWHYPTLGCWDWAAESFGEWDLLFDKKLQKAERGWSISLIPEREKLWNSWWWLKEGEEVVSVFLTGSTARGRITVWKDDPEVPRGQN